MTFPLIHPEDVPRMPEVERLVRLEWLRSEIAAAAIRNAEILAARQVRLWSEGQRGPRIEVGRVLEPSTDEAEAELVLARRRQAVAMGALRGDGGRADDLRAAHAAVKAGSINPVLQALNREYHAWRHEVARADQDSYVARRAGGRAAVTTPGRAS